MSYPHLGQERSWLNVRWSISAISQVGRLALLSTSDGGGTEEFPWLFLRERRSGLKVCAETGCIQLDFLSFECGIKLK